jgi:hypothetical protein
MPLDRIVKAAQASSLPHSAFALPHSEGKARQFAAINAAQESVVY